MTWQYGLKHRIIDKEDWYELTEIYGCNSFVSDSIVISGDSKEAIIKQLKLVILDLESDNCVILEDK